MNKNIKRMFFVTTLILLLVSITALSAVDATNDTSSTSQHDIVKEVNVEKVSDNTITDTSTKNIKKEAKTHIVNNDTITNVFSKEGTSPYAGYGFNSSLLGDDINDGDTIDIQGSITGNYNLTINKAVNIISSTHDGLIDLNTTSNNLVGDSPGNHFIIDYEGAYTNVTGIKFHNTQLFVRNTTHVTLDNISVINERQIGGGIGATAIRANATYITLKNSYFYTKGSVSTMIALTWADYCTIDNCTIISEGSGNLLYLNYFNLIADIPEDIDINTHNNITNCYVNGGPGGISLGMLLNGKYTNVINNTIYVGGISGDTDATIINNTLYGGYIEAGKYTINNTVYDNHIICTADALVVNNTAELFSVEENSTVENNTGNFVLLGNTYLQNNNIYDLTINTNNNSVSNNSITGIIKITGNDNNLNYNNIIGYDFNPITISGRNNNITDNHLKSYNATGNDCVWVRQPTQNIIANNTPESNVNNIIITEYSYSQYFDNDGLFNSKINNNSNIILKDSFTNKNFTFKNVYAGLFGDNAILYNSTIKLDENTHMGINNITLNNSLYNSKNSIIINSEHNRIDNTTIYQGGNAEDIESIIINAKNNRLYNNTITIIPNSNNINTTAIKTTAEKINISDNNIFIVKDSLNSAKAIDLGSNNNTLYKNNIIINSINIEAINLNNSGGNIILSNKINLTGTNINAIKATIGNSSNNNISRNTIDLKSSNDAIGILIDTPEQIDSNNMEGNTIYANVTNNLTLIRVTQETTTDYSTVSKTRLVSNNLYANASNVIGIVLTSVEPYFNNNKIYLNATANITENVDDYIIHSNTAIILQNSSYIEMYNEKYYLQNIEALRLNSVYNASLNIYTNTTNTIPLYIHNSYNILAHKSLNFNTTELNTIEIKNCDNITITNNQLNANDTYGGDSTVKVINSTNTTIKNNSPSLLYITNDNFYDYFDENNTLNANGTIILGSDLYNKDMIILSNITIDNRKNYTIYNGSIIFNSKNNKNNGLNINNLKFNNNINKTIITTNETNLNIQKLKINAQNNEQPIIINYNSKFTLNNSQIISNQTNPTLIEIINTTKTNSITNNYLLTNTSYAENTIKTINSTAIIRSNTPQNILELTEDNYNQYFDENCHYLGPNHQIQISSDLNNKNMVFNGFNELKITNPFNCTINNGYIIINNTQRGNIQIKINNTRINNTPLTIINSKPTIENSHISVENQATEYAIETINSTRTTISSNYLVTDINRGDEAINNDTEIIIQRNTPYPIITNENYHNYFDENGIYLGKLQVEIGSDIYNKNMIFNEAITLNGNNYTLYNSTITLNAWNTNIKNLNINNTDNRTSTIISEGYSTLENLNIYQENNQTEMNVIKIFTGEMANCNITAKGKTVDIITITGYEIAMTQLNINGEANNIKCIIASGETVVLTYSNITLTSPNPIKAIDVEMEMFTMEDVTILVNATNNGIPVIDTNEGDEGELYNLYIESLDSYGMNAINTNIYGEEIWPDLDGFGFKSEITIQTPDSILINKENHLITNPTDIFGRKINGITTLNDGEQEITTTSKIINYTPLSIGNKTLTITYIDPTRKYNTATTTTTITVITPTLTVDTLTATTGQTINITARITAGDETITNINKGKVTFKVDGKTLKDANGKVIYAKVINGTATIENYTVPSDWTKEGTTIQAVYSGSTDCDKLTSEKTNIIINKEAPTLTIDSIEPIAAGSTITLKASITDNNKEINTGKIVFKINGKTVKDENGKVIYAKVVNSQVSVNYRLPESYKAGNYTITATYIGTDYDKLTSENTISIIKT